MLSKIDEILAWEQRSEQERDTRFVELGRYLCEVRAGQYWRVDNLKSFDEFLEKKFPESRRKAYYLMSVHEQLLHQIHRDLKHAGWTKATDLAKVAHREGQNFDCSSITRGHILCCWSCALFDQAWKRGWPRRESRSVSLISKMGYSPCKLHLRSAGRI